MPIWLLRWSFYCPDWPKNNFLYYTYIQTTAAVDRKLSRYERLALDLDERGYTVFNWSLRDADFETNFLGLKYGPFFGQFY